MTCYTLYLEGKRRNDFFEGNFRGTKKGRFIVMKKTDNLDSFYYGEPVFDTNSICELKVYMDCNGLKLGDMLSYSGTDEIRECGSFREYDLAEKG